ncbi:MAG: methyltransferase domain-containing protein [Candidatus Hydrogenedentota bacterium]
MADNHNEVTDTTKAYYDSDDAQNFYYLLWGGEDLHLGIYERPDEPIADASRRTILRMASLVPGLDDQMHVLDLGGGFSGSARRLAKNFGCNVTVLNLSERENERGRRMNAEQGLADKITVVDGCFEDVPFDDGHFDVVWSQDAILHSSDRDKVISEAARVLKPGGHLVFTDIMMTDQCPPDVLQPIFDRIHLNSLGSQSFYRQAAAANGLMEVEYIDLDEHLPHHYQRVLDELEAKEQAVSEVISDAYRTNMKTGLRHWVNGGRNGYLTWGILHFQK